MTDGAVHHIAAAGHHEAHVLGPLEDLGGCLDEIFRTFLEGDTAKEGDYLVPDSPFDHHIVAAAEVHCIVDGHDFGGVDAILGDDDIAGEVAHGDDLVGRHHTVLLYGEDAGVDVVHAAAVEGGGVDVDDQRLAGQALGGDAGIVGEPVVGVDHVEFILVLDGYRAAHKGVAGNLFHKVGAIFPGELVFLSILDAEILDLAAALFLNELVELLRVHVGDHIGADVDELDLVQQVLHVQTF